MKNRGRNNGYFYRIHYVIKEGKWAGVHIFACRGCDKNRMIVKIKEQGNPVFFVEKVYN